jgi:integrase
VIGPRAFSSLELKHYVTVAQRMSQKKAVRDNIGRAKKGLVAKSTHGKGGMELAICALRHLFSYPVANGVLPANPAEKLKKPRRNETKRRSLSDKKLPEFLDAVAGGGDDPEFDVMMCAFHMETGARQGGAVSLQVGHLRWANQMVELTEKGAKVADQPVSLELLEQLESFAISRGGEACDHKSPAYDPTRPVFYYLHPMDSSDGSPVPHPLSDRRYDTLYKRIQKSLPWANEIGLTNHCIRRTGASIIERIAGTQTARLFLRHGNRNVTDIYAQSSLQRLATAVSIYTGSAHPLSDQDPEAPAPADGEGPHLLPTATPIHHDPSTPQPT